MLSFIEKTWQKVRTDNRYRRLILMEAIHWFLLFGIVIFLIMLN